MKKKYLVILAFLLSACSRHIYENQSQKPFYLLGFGCCFQNDSLAVTVNNKKVFSGVIYTDPRTNENNAGSISVKSENKNSAIRLQIEIANKKLLKVFKIPPVDRTRFIYVFYYRDSLYINLTDTPLRG